MHKIFSNLIGFLNFKFHGSIDGYGVGTGYISGCGSGYGSGDYYGDGYTCQ